MIIRTVYKIMNMKTGQFSDGCGWTTEDNAREWTRPAQLKAHVTTNTRRLGRWDYMRGIYDPLMTEIVECEVEVRNVSFKTLQEFRDSTDRRKKREKH
jgi:hypothetical protein